MSTLGGKRTFIPNYGWQANGARTKVRPCLINRIGLPIAHPRKDPAVVVIACSRPSGIRTSTNACASGMPKRVTIPVSIVVGPRRE